MHPIERPRRVQTAKCQAGGGEWKFVTFSSVSGRRRVQICEGLIQAKFFPTSSIAQKDEVNMCCKFVQFLLFAIQAEVQAVLQNAQALPRA